MLTQAHLRQNLNYNPDTGVFTRILPAHRSGSITGGADLRGYIRISLDNKNYYAHRLAWLYMTGELPTAYVDHINGTISDNRWANLRLATHVENLCNSKRRVNNTSGFKGVSWHIRTKKWCAAIAKGNRQYWLGAFATKEEAHLAYQKAADNLHGEFARFE